MFQTFDFHWSYKQTAPPQTMLLQPRCLSVDAEMTRRTFKTLKTKSNRV